MADQFKDAVDEVLTAFHEFKETNDRALKDKASNRAVSDLEAKLDKINDHLDRFEPLSRDITLTSQQNKAMQEQLDQIEKLMNRPGAAGQGSTNREVIAAFDRAIRAPASDRDPRDVSLIRGHMNALIKADDSSAGYLLAPPDMQKDIIKDIVEMTPIRALATVRTIGSGSFKRPKRVGTGSATRVGETAPRSNTGDPEYGMVEILAPEMFARVEVSQQMLEDSDYDIGAELRSEASEQFAVKEGYEYLFGTGAGTNQAEGLMLNTAIGSVNSGDASKITADGMISLYYGVKTGYARNGVFGLNRLSLRDVRKLKDTTNQYLWVPGLANGMANTILGAPYVEMPDMPVAGADAFPVVYGDFSRYAVIDRIGIGFQSDFITGADHGLVVFRARKRTGGGVLQPEAFKKLKCST